MCEHRLDGGENGDAGRRVDKYEPVLTAGRPAARLDRSMLALEHDNRWSCGGGPIELNAGVIWMRAAADYGRVGE
jgi:hypothetical protein